MKDYRNHSLLQARQYVTDEQLEAEKGILALDTMERRGELQAAARGTSRRRFLGTAGLAMGAAATVGLAGCSNSSTLTTQPVGTTPTVGDVLNFALNLEYLEATFYLTLTTGTGLQQADMGGSPGAVTGGLAQVAFTDPGVQDLANQLAADEQAHVQFLRATLTALSITPVDMPALNLAALGGVTSDYSFLSIARQLETTGTSAYEGGIGLLVSNLTALAYAATIHATEGQHEGALRQYCIANGVYSGQVDSGDVVPTASAIFNTNAGLNTSRFPNQVLQIVYAAGGALGVTKGGFYPNGMNGNIVST
jgi:hypothetical protein